MSRLLLLLLCPLCLFTACLDEEFEPLGENVFDDNQADFRLISVERNGPTAGVGIITLNLETDYARANPTQQALLEEMVIFIPSANRDVVRPVDDTRIMIANQRLDQRNCYTFRWRLTGSGSGTTSNVELCVDPA